MATELAVREILAERGDPGYFATPYLHSLLNQLEADGHRVDDIRRELDRLISIVYACRDSIGPDRRG